MKTPIYLEDSVVRRGGITAQYLEDETYDISFWPGDAWTTGTFAFSIASKGGGTTMINFKIGRKDLGPILEQILENVPGVSQSFLELTDRAHEIANIEREIRSGLM